SGGQAGSPVRAIGLGFAGRRDEARALLQRLDDPNAVRAYKLWIEMLRPWADRRNHDLLAVFAAMHQMTGLGIVKDPESRFMEGWMLCEVGEHEAGLERVASGVAAGYWAAPTLRHSPHFDALRNTPKFQEILQEAVIRRLQALEAFRAAGGEKLLA